MAHRATRRDRRPTARPTARPIGRLLTLAALAVVVATSAMSGCADVSGAPDVAVALEFDSIPYPAVLAGDSLRDSLGNAAPLRGIAYNASGAVIAMAPIGFLSRDTGVVIDASGLLATTRRSGTIRLLASINGLQSRERTITVTRRPDTLLAPTDTSVAYSYALPDVATNVSPDLKVTLQSYDIAGGVTPAVTGWLVRWRVVHAGDTLSQTDTTRVVLQGPAGRRATLDTTKTDGTSTRRLRVFANTITPATDSFVVVADVRRFGVRVAGSPVRFVVHVAPPAP